MGNSRLASKIIVLVRDADGFGPAISDALQPSPSSNLTRSASSPFELSLEKYGITDCRDSADLVHFIDPHGSPQVSILLLPNYGTPAASYAIKEVLASISSEHCANKPTIIIPFIMKTLTTNREMVSQTAVEQEVILYGAQLGDTTEFTQAMIAGTSTIPSSLKISCESLACLLQIIRVLSLSTVLLIASGVYDRYNSSKDLELEALYTLGSSLASHVGLFFSKDKIQWKQVEKTRAAQEPWRALYG